MVLLLVFMQLTRDLFAIAKFLFTSVSLLMSNYPRKARQGAWPGSRDPRDFQPVSLEQCEIWPYLI